MNLENYRQFQISYTITKTSNTGVFYLLKSSHICGIASDSQNRILIVDNHNNCIYILDQEGQSLRFIKTCGLRGIITGVCVDSKDNFFVANNSIEGIQKVKYYL